ncbi:MAG TPA: hypothetical protein DCR93_37365 [Cytophagales bacterium]|nr:hypothetical protein [Cytophagales bacterium]HAP64920.1 hypothetical protein [Cytophagales bacterium]
MKKLAFIFIALLIGVSVQGQGISRNWTSFAQTIEIPSDAGTKFKVIASVKVETTDEEAQAGVWARVDNKPGTGRGFFDNMGNRPITSNQWESYTVQGTLNENSEKLVFGGICYNNGKFFFDDFEVFIADENGDYQAIDIENPGFETEIVDNENPGWNLGIRQGDNAVIKEFSNTSSTDKANGNYSYLIEGSGVKEEGSLSDTYPNIGTLIGLIYLLVFVVIIMTYTSSSDSEKWSALSKIGFRFSFIYFLFFIFFHNNGAYPFFMEIFGSIVERMQMFAPWFADKVLGFPYAINTGPNGSGDTSYDYLVLFIGFFTATSGALVWSLLDRKRQNYGKLYYWLTTGMRYYVGLMLISYGMVKVIQLQFPEPGFYRLMENYGDSSPMGLAWTFLGFSKGYNLFMGIAEVLAGLLLFRRTMTAGAIITLMTAMNVMAVNYFYDVPVKLLSTHLVLMAAFLLARDFRKLVLFLFTKHSVANVSTIQRPALEKRPKLNKGIKIGLLVLKIAILVNALGVGTYEVLQSQKQYGSKAPKPVLYGVYEVENDLLVNGDTLTDYRNDLLWRTMVFEREGRATVTTVNKNQAYYGVQVDTANQQITFTGTSSFVMDYELTNERLDFTYILQGDTVSAQTRRLDQDDFLLTNRGFNWINERPFNR